MAGKSLTQRLADLRQKKEDIDAQIKQIEQEQNQRLRREQQERARIIGMAMLRLVEQGEDWTGEKLMGLVSPFIISGKERRFLGLEVASTSSKKRTAKSSSVKAKSDLASRPSTPSPTLSSKPPSKADTPKQTKATSSKATPKESSRERLPEASSEEDILKEFNL